MDLDKHLQHFYHFILRESELMVKEKRELDSKNKRRNYFMYFLLTLFIILFTCKVFEII
jgi:hypothetical protein